MLDCIKLMVLVLANDHISTLLKGTGAITRPMSATANGWYIRQADFGKTELTVVNLLGSNIKIGWSGGKIGGHEELLDGR